MNTNILMVLTSHAVLGDTGSKTGFWLEEFATPYYVFVDNGLAVTVASPAGGPLPRHVETAESGPPPWIGLDDM